MSCGQSGLSVTECKMHFSRIRVSHAYILDISCSWCAIEINISRLNCTQLLFSPFHIVIAPDVFAPAVAASLRFVV